MRSVSELTRSCYYPLTGLDTPYDTVEEAQAWWQSIDLSKEEKEAVGRSNAIRLFKLPLEE
jgi:2,3-dihydroxybenzoate decarboxylase